LGSRPRLGFWSRGEGRRAKPPLFHFGIFRPKSAWTTHFPATP
jgi:hypothetical protein